MTKKNFIELLNKNYKDDDEVFIMYNDEQGMCITGLGLGHIIEDITQDYMESHLEVLNENGVWVKWDKIGYGAHPSRNGIARDKWRRVIDRKWSETKRCICV